MNTLHYARHFGLAIDHQSTFLADLLSLGSNESLANKSSEFSYPSDSEIDFRIFEHHRLALLNSGSDNLKLTLEEASLLSQAEASPAISCELNSREFWNLHLPDPSWSQKLKLHLPLLTVVGGDMMEDIQSLKQSDHADNLLREITREQIDRRELGNMEDHLEWNSWLHEGSRSNFAIETVISEEKLPVTFEALNVLSNIGTFVLTKDVLDEAYRSALGELILRHSTNPMPPMLHLGDLPVDLDDKLPDSNDHTYSSPFPFLQDIDTICDRNFSDDQPDFLAKSTVGTGRSQEHYTVNNTIQSDESDMLADPGLNRPSQAAAMAYLRISGCKRQKIENPSRMDDLDVKALPILDTGQLGAWDVMEELGKVGNLNITHLLKQGQLHTSIPGSPSLSFDEMASNNLKIESNGCGAGDSRASLMNTYNSDALNKLYLPDIAPYVPQDPIEGLELLGEVLSGRDLITENNFIVDEKLMRSSFRVPTTKDLLDNPAILESLFLQNMLGVPGCVMKSHEMLWKQPGLRILEHEAEDLKILDSDYLLWKKDDHGCCLNSVTTTAQLHLSSELSVPSCNTITTVGSVPFVNASSPVSHAISSTELLPRQGVSCSPITYLHASTSSATGKGDSKFIPRTITAPAASFSATNMLSKFLDLRGKKFPNPKLISDHVASESVEDPIQASQSSDLLDNIDGRNRTPALNKGTVKETVNFEASMFRHGLAHLKEPRSVVVNTSLLTSKPRVTCLLESGVHGPLSIIYRDFDPSFEAVPDIVLNPRTCLLFTQLQILTQRNLPGQGGQALSSFHARINGLTNSYDIIYVLVSYNAQRGLEIEEQKTMNTFSVFCASFTVSDPVLKVNPIWVPFSTPTNLQAGINTWTWQIITQQAFMNKPLVSSDLCEAHEVCFIEEETLWELFLRRAGLNAMAAQVVCTVMKRSQKAAAKQSWGLQNFLTMTSSERLVIFEPWLGKRLIERIGVVIECKLGTDIQNIEL